MRRLTFALLALIALAAEARGAGLPAVLGRNGEVYRVLQGQHGQLFGGASAEDNASLALEIVHPGAASERVLVPGTDGAAVEKYPAITLDKASNTVFLVWEAQESIHSTLHLAAYAGGTWSNVFELSGDPFSFKYNPQVAITSEAYSVIDPAGNSSTRTRVALHVAWWDEGALGGRALYAALNVQDGAFVPDWQVFSLADFLPAADAVASPGPLGLYSSPQVRASGDGRSVVVAFGDRATNRLATIAISPVSGSLVNLADLARAQIIEIGKATAPRPVMAEQARAQIIEIGRRLVAPDVAEFLASRSSELWTSADPAESVVSIADRARAQIIEIGARLSSGPQVMTGAARAQIIEIGRAMDEGDPAHLSQFRNARTFVAPWVPDRTIRLLAPEDGEELALAWDLDTSIRYRQSEGDGWTDVRSLSVTDQLSREEAYALISRRLQQR